MSVKIGSARIDERGRARGGKAGDQKSGREVSIQDWYAHSPSWNIVIRAKDKNKRKKIANAMKKACSNNNIGYDQYQRLTLYNQSKKHDYDISKVKTKCECDCSSLVALCLIASGFTKINPACTTSSIERDVRNKYPNDFYFLTSREYTKSSSKIVEGDIINCAGSHVVVCTSSTNSSNSSDDNKNSNDSKKSVSSNSKVVSLQNALNKDINSKLAVDGIIGTNTKNAMKKVAIKKPTIGNNKKYPNITKFVQKQLGVAVDGIYGKNTKAKVVAFQKRKGLSQDGIVGYNTLLALVK